METVDGASLCSNCWDTSGAKATVACLNCEASTSPPTCFLFCDECFEVHCHLKANRSHVSRKLEVANVPSVCVNCERGSVYYVCLDCPVADRYLCRTCGSCHSKVRAYREHTLREQQSASTNSGLFIVVRSLSSWWHRCAASASEFFSELMIEHGNNWTNALAGVLIATVLHFGVKFFFGKLSLTIYALAALGLLAYLRHWNANRSEALERIAKVHDEFILFDLIFFTLLQCRHHDHC